MKDKINSLFATLIIVVAGAGAAWLIYHLATTNTLTSKWSGSEEKYAPLQNSILNQ